MGVADTINDFAGKSGNGMFPKITRSKVADGLRERVNKPWAIDQGRASLCGPAALVFAVARKSAQEYVDYVTELYDTGSARLTDHWIIPVEPGSDCRNADPAGDPPGVDWVALASLRDSENDFVDYQDPEDQVAGITSPSMLSVWLKHCGFGSRVNKTNVFFTKDRENLEEASRLHNAGHTVCLLCKGDTVKGIPGGWSSTPSHWVVMTRAPQFSSGSVSMKVFTWGQDRELSMSQSVFFSTYFGFVSGKR
jgi:hypothetical protein